MNKEQAMVCIVNLTRQQTLTREQMEADAVPLNEYRGSEKQPSDAVKELLTFEFPPTQKEISDRGREIAEIAAAAVEAHQKSDDDNRRMEFALIDEPTFMIPTLARELRNQGLKPVISFIGRRKNDIKDRPLRHIEFIEV